ncbi:MAG TPA: sensor histidine kinase [Kofleriaceae bacterium]|nr:sensor histidine kinase [Kofleriaceae bacterium]
MAKPRLTSLTPTGLAGHAAIYPFLLGLAAPASQAFTAGTPSPALAIGILIVFLAGFIAIVQISRPPGAPVQVMVLTPARRRAARALTALLFAIAVTTLTRFGGNWWVLFMYVVTTMMFMVPVGWELTAIAGVSLVMTGCGWLYGWPLAEAASFALSVAMAGFVALLMRRRGVLIRELGQAHAEVARLAAADAVVEERLRFARDLHDLLGHSLSVIALKTELARRLLDGGAERARVVGELADVEQITRRALGEVREAVTGYRAASLTSELARAKAALEAADVEVITRIAVPALAPEVDDLLAWIVREATTNIVRHSHARRAEIEVCQADGTIRIDVHNDGVIAAPATTGSGLAGLRERVHDAGGRLTSIHDGARFHVSASVPASGEASGAASVPANVSASVSASVPASGTTSVPANGAANGTTIGAAFDSASKSAGGPATDPARDAASEPVSDPAGGPAGAAA